MRKSGQASRTRVRIERKDMCNWDLAHSTGAVVDFIVTNLGK